MTVKKPLEGLEGAFRADPEQAGDPLVDLVDQSQVLVAFGVSVGCVEIIDDIDSEVAAVAIELAPSVRLKVELCSAGGVEEAANQFALS